MAQSGDKRQLIASPLTTWYTMISGARSGARAVERHDEVLASKLFANFKPRPAVPQRCTVGAENVSAR
ncbi:hypothetical protein F6P93_12665 [Escherichia coli]|nr:hypothetical protein F6P93_12665 [Escherichia coli]